MIAYNATNFDPPAPVASVNVKHYISDAMITDVLMQLDTGADVTLIPQTVVNHLGLTILTDTSYALEGFDGKVSEAFAVEIRLIFCRRTFRGKFLITDQSIGVIGRDILNLVPLLLDGPRLVWSEYHP